MAVTRHLSTNQSHGGIEAEIAEREEGFARIKAARERELAEQQAA